MQRLQRRCVFAVEFSLSRIDPVFFQATAGPPPSNGNAWTTVGPNGKTSAAPPISVRPSAPLSTPKVAASPAQKTSANATVKPKPPPKQEEVTESPSHDFLKWLSDSLKGLNSSVNGMFYHNLTPQTLTPVSGRNCLYAALIPSRSGCFHIGNHFRYHLLEQHDS